MGVSGTVANGAAQTNRTDETTTTAKAALRSRREAGMVERKMLRLLAACTDLSSKLASTRHLSHRQTTGFAAPAYLADWSIAAAPGVTSVSSWLNSRFHTTETSSRQKPLDGRNHPFTLHSE